MENIVPETQENPEVAAVEATPEVEVTETPKAAPAALLQKIPKKILMIAIPAVIVAIIVAVIVGITVSKNNKYKDAVAFADDGDIEEAIAIHEELGDYKDLAAKIGEGAVEELESLLKKNSYKKVIKLYEQMGNYPDAIEEMNSELGKHVKKLFSSSKTSEIGDIYDRSIGTSAEATVAQAVANGASEWLETGNFYDVMSIYQMIVENEAAANTLETLIVEKFAQLVADRNYDAYDLYNSLQSYEIHFEGVLETIYQYACECQAEGNYEDAIYIFEDLGEYKDAADLALECRFGMDKNKMNYYLDNEWFWDARNLLSNYTGAQYDELAELYLTAAIDRVKYYADSGWYWDANYFVNEHEGEIKDALAAVYKTYCGDETFLADLEAAVIARLELVNADSTDYQAMVDAQMNLLSKYESMPFFDETLGDLADSYLDILDDQQYYINWYSSYWYLPYYMGQEDSEMLAVLTTLNESYGFGAENAEIMAVIGMTEDLAAYWEAWYSINYDLRNDLDYIFTDYSEGYRYMSYYNNTSYTYSLALHIIYTDNDGNEVGTQDFSFADLTPDTEMQIIVEIPENASYWEAEWEFTDITLDGESIKDFG